MYFVLRAPYSMHICAKGIGFHENRMIDVAAELRASWHRSCMHVLLPTSSSICIPILIHRKGSPSFLLASHFSPAQPIIVNHSQGVPWNVIRNYTRFSGENLDSGTELALTSASYVGMYASRPLDALVQLDPDGLDQVISTFIVINFRLSPIN